jgi:SAM-dependent methyltransferase
VNEAQRIREVYEARKQSIPADRYSYRNAGTRLIERELEDVLLSRLPDLRDKRILEVGCGRGARLQNLIRWGALSKNLVGVEVIKERADETRNSLPNDTWISHASAESLHHFGTFDLIFQFTMFTSILDLEVKKNIASEMLCALRPGGMIVWYDMFWKNPRNPHIQPISKQEIRELFPGCDIRFNRVTLVAPLARRLGQYSPLACRALAALKFLSTHYVALISERQKAQLAPRILKM